DEVLVDFHKATHQSVMIVLQRKMHGAEATLVELPCKGGFESHDLSGKTCMSCSSCNMQWSVNKWHEVGLFQHVGLHLNQLVEQVYVPILCSYDQRVVHDYMI
ncbi:hypothetical protein VIGAN_02069000, partial [Vigna angularis var. angularis]